MKIMINNNPIEITAAELGKMVVSGKLLTGSVIRFEENYTVHNVGGIQFASAFFSLGDSSGFPFAFCIPGETGILYCYFYAVDKEKLLEALIEKEIIYIPVEAGRGEKNES